VPEGAVKVAASDRWVRRLLTVAIASLLLGLVLFVGFKVLLAMGSNGLRAIAVVF
jgi:hypothetical protein